MVDITPEEVMALRQQEKNLAELNDLDRRIIGRAVRIEIPFTSVYNMREIAGMLRAYADTLDVYSRRTDMPQRSILLHLKFEANAINRRIRDLHGRHNKNGTTR